MSATDLLILYGVFLPEVRRRQNVDKDNPNDFESEMWSCAGTGNGQKTEGDERTVRTSCEICSWTEKTHRGGSIQQFLLMGGEYKNLQVCWKLAVQSQSCVLAGTHLPHILRNFQMMKCQFHPRTVRLHLWCSNHRRSWNVRPFWTEPWLTALSSVFSPTGDVVERGFGWQDETCQAPPSCPPPPLFLRRWGPINGSEWSETD